MLSNLWCEKHRKMARKEAGGYLNDLLFAARIMERFRDHPKIERAATTDPVWVTQGVSLLTANTPSTRLLGILAVTRCVCCVVGDEVVKEIAMLSPLPLSETPAATGGEPTGV